MNSFTCHAIHFKKWQPFQGQYWCPICETLRIGNTMKPARLITQGVTKILRNTKEDKDEI